MTNPGHSSTQARADEAVDHILAGLQQGPRQGLEARIADRLAATQANQRASALWKRPLFGLGPALCSAAIAGLVLAITLPRSDRNPAAVVSGVSSRAELGSVAEQRSELARQPMTHPKIARRVTHGVPPAQPSSWEAGPTARQRQLFDDFNAPTQVAPPIPLSPEERMLHRLIRDASARQVASLDPIRQEFESDRADADHARANAEYDSFFRTPPPSPPLEPVPDSAEQKGSQP